MSLAHNQWDDVKPRIRRWPTSLIAVALTSVIAATSGNARPSIPDDRAAAYAQVTRQAQADLDAGRRDDVQRRLNSTDSAQRSFEFDYLQARLQTAKAGTPTDLVRKLAKPDVESRYGVLNGVNRQVVFICRDGGLRIHDLTAAESLPKLVAHPAGASIWSGVFSRDGATFFSGHQNGEVLVWDAANWKVRHTIHVGDNWPVRELAAAPDGSAFVAESQMQLELWSLAGATPTRVATVGPRYNFGEGLAFSPTGDKIATGGMFDILLYNSKTGEQIRSLRHASYTMGLEFSPDGKRIASAPRGNVNKFLAVFEVTQPNPLFNAGPFQDYVAGMAFTPDGKRIAVTSCEKELRLFDASTGEIVLALKRAACGAKPAFTHDGRLLGWSEPEGFFYVNLVEKPKP